MTVRHAEAQGFSLIEVLITVFVVSVGLLSIAGLQAVSKKANFDSIQRSTASALAQEIIERMRANPAGLQTYIQGTPLTPSMLATATNAASPTNCKASTVSITTTAPACPQSTQIATFDLYTFSQHVAGVAESAGTTGNVGGLASPSVCITQVSNCTVAVAIAWRGLTPVAATAASSNDPAGFPCNNSDSAYLVPQVANAPAGFTMRRVLVVQAAIRDPSSKLAFCP